MMSDKDMLDWLDNGDNYRAVVCGVGCDDTGWYSGCDLDELYPSFRDVLDVLIEKTRSEALIEALTIMMNTALLNGWAVAQESRRRDAYEVGRKALAKYGGKECAEVRK